MISLWGKLTSPSVDQGDPNASSTKEDNPKPNAKNKFYYSSNSGQVLSADGSGYVIPEMRDIVAEKTDFVPKETAIEKVQDMLKDSSKFHEMYLENVEKLNKFYQEALNDSRNHYEGLITDLKEKALRHITVQKSMRSQVEDKLTKELKASEEALDELRDSMADLKRKYQDEVRILKGKLLDSETNVTKITKNYERLEETSSLHLTMNDLVTKVELLNAKDINAQQLQSFNTTINTMNQDFANQVQTNETNHQLELQNIQLNQIQTQQCQEVMQYLLTTLEINALKENMIQLAQLQTQIQEIDQAYRESQELIAQKQQALDELQAQSIQQQELLEANQIQIQELQASFEQEQSMIKGEQDQEIKHLKKKFNLLLKQLKQDKEHLEVEMTLQELVHQVSETEATSVLLSTQTTSSTLTNQLQETQTKHQQEISDLQNNFQNKFEQLKNKFNVKYKQSQQSNIRLSVQLILQSMVSTIVDQNPVVITIKEEVQVPVPVVTSVNPEVPTLLVPSTGDQSLPQQPTDSPRIEKQQKQKSPRFNTNENIIIENTNINNNENSNTNNESLLQEISTLREQLLQAQQQIQLQAQSLLTNNPYVNNPTIETSSATTPSIIPIAQPSTSSLQPIAVSSPNPEIKSIQQKIIELEKQINEEEIQLKNILTLLSQNVQERDQSKMEIKNWTKEFVEQNGREPEVSDKAQIRDKFQRYKNATNAVKEYDGKQGEIQQRIGPLREEVTKLKEQLALTPETITIMQAPPQSASLSQTMSLPQEVSLLTTPPTADFTSPPQTQAPILVAQIPKDMMDAEVQVIPTELRQLTLKKIPTMTSNEASTTANNNNEAGQAQAALQAAQDSAAEMQAKQEEIIEQLEDQLYAIKQEQLQLQTNVQKISEEKAFIQNQYDILYKEKRTDVLQSYEEQLKTLRLTHDELQEKFAILNNEKTKLENKVKELKERSEKAEEELRQRDLQILQQLQQTDEKYRLHDQLTKQRDQIIQKSKAATAGWDAAANADEKLEIEVQKAYQKGYKDCKEQLTQDNKKIHESLEQKETRITELLKQLGDMELTVKHNEDSKIQMTQQMENLKLEVTDALAALQSMAQMGGGRGSEGGNEDEEYTGMNMNSEEIDKLHEQIDTTQEELMQMIEKCDKLEEDLVLARKKNRLYENLIKANGNMPGGAGGGGSDGTGGGTLAPVASVPAVNNFNLDDVLDKVRKAITKGTNLWKSNRKDDCFDLYLDACQDAANRLLTDELSKPLRDSIEHGSNQGKQNKQRGAVFLRKALDKFLADAGQPALKAAEEAAAVSMKENKLKADNFEMETAHQRRQSIVSALDQIDSDLLAQGYTKENNPTNTDAPISPRDMSASSIMLRAKNAEEKVKTLQRQLHALITATASNQAPASDAGTGAPVASTAAGGSTSAPTATLPAKAAQGSADPAEIRRLNRRIKELETQLKSGGGSGGGGGGGQGGGPSAGISAAELKQFQQNEKNLNKKLKDQETQFKRETKNLEMRATKAENALTKLQSTYQTISEENTKFKSENQALQEMSKEFQNLKQIKDNYVSLQSQYTVQQQEYNNLAEQFKKETQLRKKYKNELEDLKGAIRVFARCRPMARYEIERGCKQVVEIKDESSLKLLTSRGEKEFEFDSVFSAVSTQDQVFEDTKRLVESCLDGFNVCVFAYGQTGSGKTFTMTGSPSNPGLTPRAVDELFRLIGERSHLQCKVTTYFVELYNDNLVDLFYVLDNRKNASSDPPKLEIKMDAKKMVFIRNSVIKDVNSPQELMELFEKGNAERHTGATKMNAESSRSHSIFAIMVESYDSTTKRTTTGKLSLVDLAGSERADKTGAAADRLKEAQSINKSLSALGDVIAALSEGGKDKFIPYRNNKLTQLMQDSLGGNAKTLMFVNFSPADYNADETSTSLMYASRVKKIVNNASKQAESEEVARLKAIIKRLQSGQTIADLEPAEQPVEEMPPIAEDDGKVYDGY